MPKKKVQNNYVRPSWDEYFLNLVDIIGQRSTCDRGRPGCVIVKDRRILASGYAGSPVGLPHCDEIGHEMQKAVNEDGTITEHCIRTIHAEMNAISQAAKFGIPIEGSTLYVKFTPCYNCAKVVINSGIKRVVSKVKYHAGDKTKKLFKDAKIKLEIIENKIEKYERQ